VIVGCGLDLIDIARFEGELSRHGDGLLTEVLSDVERQRAAALPRPACGHAAVFAAKEACFKALGTGMIGRMSWRDITVIADRGQPPCLTLAGETARVAAGHGVDQIHTTIALTRDVAIAWVVLWRMHGV
jgi:holo-[acyl-carrier protein] synthase